MIANMDLLNAVRAQIIRAADASGIMLADEFGTVEEFQKFIFSITIVALMDVGGITIERAYEIVMGAGAWQALADDVWLAAQHQR
jgi:hypothetical protein